MKTIPQDEDRVPVTVHLRKTIDRALEAEAFKQQSTKREVVEAALIDHLGLKEANAA